MARNKGNDIITGIDIGTTSIRIAVGQRRDGHKKSVHIIGVAEVPSEGIQRGIVTSLEDAVSSLSSTLEHIERLLGAPIESGWIGLGGTHNMAQASRGVVSVAKADGEIGVDDVERAIQAARMVAPPLNFEMLHVLPRGFVVDGQTGIKDPVGMTGIRLEVETNIIHGQTTHINNITKTVYRTGIAIDDLVLSILATGAVVTTARQRELGVAVVNIGGTTTSLIVYEQGDVLAVESIPLGSDHIPNDLAIGLRTSIDVAEQVKCQYGYCIAGAIGKKERVSLSDFPGGAEEAIPRSYIAEIIEARMAEILEHVETALIRVGRSGLLPAGVVFTGGGAKIGGLVELGKEVLALPASLGYPVDVMSSTDKINDLACTTAIGLVVWGAQVEEGSGRPIRKASGEFTRKAGEKIQGFLKSLIP